MKCTFDGKDELLITIMSSPAQEESRSISENITLGTAQELLRWQSVSAVMHDWNDTIWTVMVEKAIVHKAGHTNHQLKCATRILIAIP